MDRATARMIIESLNRDAEKIASRFGLRYQAIRAERANVKSRYGICYSDGTIQIRLRHAVTGRPLRYSSLVSTLCHELAHLRHFNHGPRFRDFYLQLLEYARFQRIYRPGRPPVRVGARSGDPTSAPRDVPTVSAPKPAAPTQLSLFPAACEPVA
jgi:hypothetical protein